MENIEVAVPFWKNIARALGCHEITAIRMKDELQTAGVIFYRRKRNNKKIVHHFPSTLRAWVALKSSKGEII